MKRRDLSLTLSLAALLCGAALLAGCNKPSPSSGAARPDPSAGAPAAKAAPAPAAAAAKPKKREPLPTLEPLTVPRAERVVHLFYTGVVNGEVDPCG